MTENEDSKRAIWRSCCRSILFDAKMITGLAGECLGNKEVIKVLRDTNNFFKGKGCIRDGYLQSIIEALKKDISRDPYATGLKQFAPKNGEKIVHSYEKSISFMESLLDELEDSRDGYLKFIQYMSQNRSKQIDIDLEKVERNRRRILKNTGSDEPSDSFPSLRDQFKHGFEELYLQVAEESKDILAHYPGINKDKAYRAFEEMVALERVHTDKNDGFKSDYRAIRNCISHEDYSEIGDNMEMSFEDENKMTVDILDFAFLSTSMLQKCIYIKQLISLMNIEVIRRAEKYVSDADTNGHNQNN